jgi:hemerythrin
MKKTSDLIWQDTQHQILFELIEELKSHTARPEIFIKLTNFAENHFLLEEEYMHQLNYLNIDEYIAAHDRFRVELEVMTQNPSEFDIQMRETISIFLREWLTRHIFGIDKDLEAFILNSNQK